MFEKLTFFMADAVKRKLSHKKATELEGYWPSIKLVTDILETGFTENRYGGGHNLGFLKDSGPLPTPTEQADFKKFCERVQTADRIEVAFSGLSVSHYSLDISFYRDDEQPDDATMHLNLEITKTGQHGRLTDHRFF